MTNTIEFITSKIDSLNQEIEAKAEVIKECSNKLKFPFEIAFYAKGINDHSSDIIIMTAQVMAYRQVLENLKSNE